MSVLRQNFMEPRRDWNAKGPRLPAWFRPGLRRIDPKLVLQFMVPSYVDRSGVDYQQYPLGLWIIARRMPHTGWLLISKNWTFGLYDQQTGHPKDPTHEDLNLIRMARDLRRRGETWRMEEEFDSSIRNIKRAKSQASRMAMIENMQRNMARYGMTQYGGRRIVVPEDIACV